MKKTTKLLTVISTFAVALVTSSCDKGNNSTSTQQPANPAPNVTAKYNVKKKGIGVSRYNNPTDANGKRINDLNVGWYYNWGMEPNQYINSEYVPMVWGKAQATSQNINNLKTRYENGEFSHLLTFNEPDIKDQSNMTVDEAINLWPLLESIGVPLSSPCPSSYKEGGWLDQFMEKAKALNYRVDFIAIHCYQDFSVSGIENTLKTTILERIYEKYKLPIWVTEYGAIDISVWVGDGRYNPNCTEKNAKEYIANSTKMFESLGYIERYAWFVDNFAGLYGDARPKEAPYTTLYNDDDTISSTGEIYRDIDSQVSLHIDTTSLPYGEKGVMYETKITASGGKGSYTFSCTNLPTGLNISIDGTLSGTPKYSDITKLKITVKDEENQSTYKYLTLSVR